MIDVRVTHIGGPTVLIEVGGWRILTDPTFDPPGRRYSFGWGTSSRKLAGPALAATALPPIDAVLLTHDQHADNLDERGRALLSSAGRVITTEAGARRLGNATGLTPWSSTTLTDPHPASGPVPTASDPVPTDSGPVPTDPGPVLTDPGPAPPEPARPAIEVTATPCRHGPPLSGPVTGPVTGFALTWAGQEHGALWISGDTVLYDGVREVAARLRIGTVLLHLGAVRFPVTGPLRYTMTGRDGAELCELIGARTVMPVHYEGWSHFVQGRRGIEAAFAAAPAPVRDSLHWLTPGRPEQIRT